MIGILRKFFAHNWLAIFYFNFRKLPLRQAIHLPFDFYHSVRFENLSGEIIINSPYIRRGMIKVGGRGSEMFPRSAVIFDIRGTVTFGSQVEIGNGALLRVEESACVHFGNNVRIGARSKVFCAEEIYFGNEIDFSWECQIFDTNFHDLRDTGTGVLIQKTCPVHIGDRNWFGNRVSVMKGTATPPDLTVAANSVCNKNYTALPSNTVIAGSPAKVVRTCLARIWK